MMLRRRFRRRRDGTIAVDLPAEERELLRSLPAQLTELLADGGERPELRRLFPPAYADDVEAEAEYQRLMREDLLASRRAALDALVASTDATVLDPTALDGWLRAINDLRLVLGTVLDVSEDGHEEPAADDPDAPTWHVYHYLTFLQDQAITALSGW